MEPRTGSRSLTAPTNSGSRTWSRSRAERSGADGRHGNGSGLGGGTPTTILQKKIGSRDHLRVRPFRRRLRQLVSLSYDANHSRTHSYSLGSSLGHGPSRIHARHDHIFAARHLHVGKLNITESNYLTDFRSHFGVYQNAFTPQVLSFQDQDLWHFDGRIGLEFRASRTRACVRRRLGRSAALPRRMVANTFAPLIVRRVLYPLPVGRRPSCGQSGFQPQTQSGNIVRIRHRRRLRFGDGLTVLTADAVTNLHNQLIHSTFLNGTAAVATSGGVYVSTLHDCYTNVSKRVTRASNWE